MKSIAWLLMASLSLVFGETRVVAQSASHSTLRALPELTQRPLGNGPNFFVDPVKGNDSAAGTEGGPWRAINHALKHLSAGETLCLRGGVYRENFYCAIAGKPDAPITIRA